MDAWNAVAVALTFVWLGMVVAISFIEAPIKFGAPGVTLAIGLGIGRRVFRVLNAVEVVLAVVLVAFLLFGDPGSPDGVALGIAVVVLALQLIAVRPALTRRSDAVLAGAVADDAPRSHAHLWYVGAELIKVIALVVAGSYLLVG